ncbi:MAG: ATP-binding protein [Pseudomonadota bacterium]
MIRLRDVMPKGFWPRNVLIMFVPIVAMMVGMTWYFFYGHMPSVNERLSASVARDTALIAMTHDRDPSVTLSRLDLIADTQGQTLEIRQACPVDDNRARMERRIPTVVSALDHFLDRPFEIAFVGDNDDILFCVPSGTDILVFTMPRKRAVIINGHIYIVWVLGFGLLLLAAAFGFLRNQVRSILQLTEAAKAFGRGRDMAHYSPSGATEVRDAARAVLQMKQRLTAFTEQRTALLNGVSHDLRTPLTRLKLQLAMMGESEDSKAAQRDLNQMSAMLDEYLAFARGEELEQDQPVNLTSLVKDICEQMEKPVTLSSLDMISLMGRPMALRRAITNLISNAVSYGGKVDVVLRKGPAGADLIIDDDGPGIAPEQREEAFRPFTRLDDARSQNVAGTGLGLALARDTARAHGGDVRLETSPLGGLRARLRLPV